MKELEGLGHPTPNSVLEAIAAKAAKNPPIPGNLAYDLLMRAEEPDTLDLSALKGVKRKGELGI